MSTSEKLRCQSNIKQLDGEIFHEDKNKSSKTAKDYQSYVNCTHMICSNLIRSEKLFLALLGQKWILHTSYIEDSVNAGYWLPETNYEWRTWIIKHPNCKYSNRTVNSTPFSDLTANVGVLNDVSLPGKISEGVFEALNRWPHAGDVNPQCSPPFLGWKVAFLVKGKHAPLNKMLLTLGGADPIVTSTAAINKELKGFTSKDTTPFTYAFVCVPEDDSQVGTPIQNDMISKLKECGVPCLSVSFLIHYILYDFTKGQPSLTPFLIPKLATSLPAKTDDSYEKISPTEKKSQRIGSRGRKRKSQGTIKSPVASRGRGKKLRISKK